jgi:hypothetical protein
MQGLKPRVEGKQNILQANAFNMEGSNKIELYITQFLRLFKQDIASVQYQDWRESKIFFRLIDYFRGTGKQSVPIESGLQARARDWTTN